MIGDFLNRILMMLFAYGYPAFECFKTMERNNASKEELRFWCQYWVVIALLTVCERIGDIFVSWIPMYGELKLALIIYLWYPKTKGSGYLYETLLRPFAEKHETEIERKLQEFKVKAWDFAIYYWQNCTELGQGSFVKALDYFLPRSGKSKTNFQNVLNTYEPSAPPMPSPPGSPTHGHRGPQPEITERLQQDRMRWRRSKPSKK